jgi:hypothetical protein
MIDVVFSKNHRATQLLAGDLLCRNLDERLPTYIEYQELLGFGSGTVQKAMRTLESVGAVRTRARGRQGTFIIDRSFGRLWAIAGLGLLTGTMPLPDSSEGLGLATGLREQFDKLEMDLQMRYMHGSAARLRAVREGRADFAVLSQAAAETARAAEPDRVWNRLDLGPHSYASEGSIMVVMYPGVVEAGAEAIRVVGIDPDSYDHTRLTHTEFPVSAGYRYEAHDYPSLPAAVAEGRVDAAVWHRTVLPVPVDLIGFKVRPFQRDASVSLLDSLCRAVLLAPCDRPELNAILQRLDVTNISETQGRVVRNEVLPSF